MTMHTGQTIACQKCGKHFSYKSNLKKHMRKHQD
ncbi:hypothetical protein LSH36_63g05019 [Paralvinella palmiformis]|uniref:C2H2-type domain-containing protein n=1 Tax=Paralvinella palmiformis TaxID=53620 RepID=A0AAD9NBR7_9ANNE|nr:hypothetical protein LSH36_63g05019 [Paralvinella palmiformis]